MLAGALTADSQVDRSFDEDGLTCTTCHSIQRLQSTNGNGGFVMGVPSAMVDENGNRIPGEVPDEEIMRSSRPPLQSGDADFLPDSRSSARPVTKPTCRSV